MKRKASLVDCDPFAPPERLDPLVPPEDVEARALLTQLGMPNPTVDSGAFWSERYKLAHMALCAGCVDAAGIDNWLAFEGHPQPNDTAVWWETVTRWYRADARAIAELAEYARRRTERARLMAAITALESWR